MQLGVANSFDSYDLIGKTIPGIVFLLGLSTLLPANEGLYDLLLIDGSLNYAHLVVGGLIVLVLGFVFGQGLHIIAMFIETVAYGIAVRVYYGLFTETTPTNEAEKRWYARVRDGLKTVLKPHRLMFQDHLKWYTHPETTDASVYNLFVRMCEQRFGVSSETVAKIGGIYSVIMSYLIIEGSGRAHRFQARYSFCRSIYIISGFFGTMYLVLLTGIGKSLFTTVFYTPVILEAKPTEIGALATVLILTGLMFMYAVSRYKGYFIEYLFADFYNIIEQSDLEYDGTLAAVETPMEGERPEDANYSISDYLQDLDEE